VQLPLAVPVIYFLIVTLLVAVPLVTKPRESAIGLIMMLGTGVAYYLLVIAWTSKPAVLVNKMGTSRLSHYFAPFPNSPGGVRNITISVSVRLNVRSRISEITRRNHQMCYLLFYLNVIDKGRKPLTCR